MKPTIGRIVHYTLSEQDAALINGRRADAASNRRVVANMITADVMGNQVREGDLFPAMIVRVWGDTDESAVQLQVFLDGNDMHWATSVQCGEGPRTYAWPARA